MEEYLDIVDEEDNVIGRGTRKEVHEKYLIHRGVHVLVVNREGKILVQRRAYGKADNPGYLDASVGAQVSAGESYEQTARRECLEELGFAPAELLYIGKYKSFSQRQREIRELYVSQYEGPFRLDPNEVDSVFWASPVEMQELLKKGEQFTSGFLKTLDLYTAKTDDTKEGLP